MNKAISGLSLTLTVFIVSLIITIYTPKVEVFTPKVAGITEQTFIHPQHPVVSEISFTQLKAASEVTRKIQELATTKPLAVTVPHHLIATDLISAQMQSLSSFQPKRLIILAPDHTNSGKNKVTTTIYDFQGFNNLVQTESEVIHEMVLRNQDFSIDTKTMTDEHAIGALIPFIEYYLPNTKIIPLLFRTGLTTKDITDISNVINMYIDESTIILTSIDFSHYLNLEQAQENDLYTKSLIQSRDIYTILSLSPNYLDAPGPMAVSLELANKHRAQTNFLLSSNSAIITGLTENTTSYQLYQFSRE